MFTQEFEFPEIRAKKALLAVGAGNLELAINWITDHQDDPDIDAPIPLVPMVKHNLLCVCVCVFFIIRHSKLLPVCLHYPYAFI